MKKKKFLTVLQMWEGDAEAACSLARLLADIQGGAVNQETDLMLLYRQDCRPRPKLELYCQDVFANVHVLSTRRKDAGFPAGPNAMWCELMQHAEIMHKLGKWDYTAVLTTEGDACPLTKDWSAKLLAAWEEANVPVAGCWMPGSFSQSADIGHINGNAMFDVALAQKIPKLYSCPQQHSWDMFFSKDFHKLGWKDLPEIRNLYQAQTATQKVINFWRASGCVWLHGVKDSSVRDWARKSLVAA
jgi:hypothetical protein